MYTAGWRSTDDAPTFRFGPVKPIPQRFGLIAGDCLQNLRSCLDYLVWELVLPARNTPTERHGFPICKQHKGWKGALRAGRVEGIPDEAVRIIESLQPCLLHEPERYENPLYLLDHLANVNKHRHIPLTLIKAFRSEEFPTVEIDGQLWSSSERLSMKNRTALESGIKPQDIPPGSQIVAFMSIAEGAAKEKDVSQLLNDLAAYVQTGVLSKFECFF